jgi:uncharacterized sulfatase
MIRSVVRRFAPSAAAGILLAFVMAAAAGAVHDYGLTPIRVADGVHVFVGRVAGFGRENGGNIVNTGFVVGRDGIVVIDTGPSRLYGEQQRAAIARVSLLPIALVLDTHAHPDHFLGNQVYPADRVAALPATIAAIQANGDMLADNLYRLVGGAMIGTQAVVPTVAIGAGRVGAGGSDLRLIGAAGHTDGDLMIFDEKTKTLFTGDLVFVGRAPTTPNADLPRWIATLDEIDRLEFTTLVPGHGAVIHDHAGVAATRDYLRWLGGTLRDAAQRGLDMNEVMRLPLPARFKTWAAIDEEYPRSVAHLYPKIELEALPALTPVR